MLKRLLFTALLTLSALALPAGLAHAAAKSAGAIVFSMTIDDHREFGEFGEELATKPVEGGLYAVRQGKLNRLTEDPSDSQPAFSTDGRTIAFVRGDDLYAVRADGSGLRQLTSGAELDGRPVIAPNGKYLVFERRSDEEATRDLFTVSVWGRGLRALTTSPEDDHEASFANDGRTIVFVRSFAVGGGTADDIFSVRPSGAAQRRLTRTGRIDEFAPQALGRSIVFSRGENAFGPSAYADIYVMRRDGKRVRELIAGVGSAYVEDVSANGRTVLFRREQGLWVKQLGGRSRKLAELPDESRTNAVFSSDARKVAAFVDTDEQQTLSVIDVRTGRHNYGEVVAYSGGDQTTTIGPVMAWQPVRSAAPSRRASVRSGRR